MPHLSPFTSHFSPPPLAGARLYHSAASLWLSVDPLAEKYPSVSGYVYCGGNPVGLKDPDGRDIWIIGEDCNRYRYYQGYLYTEDGNLYTPEAGSFLSDATYAIDVLKETRTGGKLVETFECTDKDAVIQNCPRSHCDNLTTDAQTGNFIEETINWNVNGTEVETTLGKQSSPIADLGHEFSHVYDNAKKIKGLSDLNSRTGGIRSEWRAVYKENLIRNESGMPYRSGYIFANPSGESYFVKMLNRKGEPYMPKDFVWLPMEFCKKIKLETNE